MLVHEFVHSAVRRFGGRTALADERGSLSYDEMWEHSTRLAGALVAHGVKPGDRVVAVMNNRNEWMEADLATSRAGAIRGRLNARDSVREFTWVLGDLAPTVVISGPEFTAQLADLRRSGQVPPFTLAGLDGGGYEEWLAAGHEFSPVPVQASDPYGIFHTSGTTGRYKGAVYLHQSWLNIYRNILAMVMADLSDDCAVVHVAPLSHQSGMLVAPALYRGARSVILERFAPEAFFEAVEREKITHTILAPALINALANHPAARSHDLSSLRCIYYSGAPIAPTVLRRAIEVFGPVFLQGYGSTEGGALYNTIMFPDEHVEALRANPERLASCGRPVPFFDVKVADDDGHEVPTGDMGEVWVRGDAASSYYWNQPEATKEAYVDGWFRMGDLAVRDEAGFITIVDRKNDMIISGGLNVYPREVEDIISEHPAVLEVAVIGVPDDKWGEAVKACVSLRPGTTLELKDLQEHCRVAGLASYKKPLSLDVVDEIPKTPVGKLFRRALREPYWANEKRKVR